MYAQLQFTFVLCGLGVDRLRSRHAGEDRESGASALEWAVISAIVITAAVLIGGIVYNVVQNKGTAITNCGNSAPAANGTCAGAG